MIYSLWKCSEGYIACKETFIQGNLLKFGKEYVVFAPRPIASRTYPS